MTDLLELSPLIAMDNFQCHKHMQEKTYKLGKPWRPLHYSPLSSQPSGHFCFEFYWQTIHNYYNLLDETTPIINTHLIKTSQESECVVSSSPVDRLKFLNEDSYARGVVDSLIPNSNSIASDYEADWIISKARLLLQEHSDCGTLLIGLELVRCHVCFESVLVQNVMDQSFEEKAVMKRASKSSLELLKRVDFDDIYHDESLPCVVCQEELFLCKEKEILDMPCKHMFHGECILQWLENSHYCPICRFKMPTI